MALLPHFSERGRLALLLAAVVAGAFGVLVAILRSDYVAATLIAVVIALLLLTWWWTRSDRAGEE
jgi:hypothetical protein